MIYGNVIFIILYFYFTPLFLYYYLLCSNANSINFSLIIFYWVFSFSISISFIFKNAMSLVIIILSAILSSSFFLIRKHQTKRPATANEEWKDQPMKNGMKIVRNDVSCSNSWVSLRYGIIFGSLSFPLFDWLPFYDFYIFYSMYY